MEHFLYEPLRKRLTHFAQQHKDSEWISEDEVVLLANELVKRQEIRLGIEIGHRKYSIENGMNTDRELVDVYAYLINEGHCDRYISQMVNEELDKIVANRIRMQLR